MGPLTMAGIAAGSAAVKTGLQAIPTKFEREQKKRLKELQRKQELGLLGLTDAERAQIESQLRGTREQAQRRSDAEIARLSTPTAQQGQQLLAAQLGAEGRQRMEADLAGQILGMDIQRQREQEADIAALEAQQGLRQAELRSNLASIPMAGAETLIGQMGLERLINVAQLTPEQRQTYLENDLQLVPEETELLQLEPVVEAPIASTGGTPNLISQLARTQIPSSTSLFTMPTDEELDAMRLLELQVLQAQQAQQDLRARGR
jgi:hypothetical protein|tara:strand:+ start:290 stop:1075 length:786 start_codon:yes stop_codon:yes gene_type:complete